MNHNMGAAKYIANVIEALGKEGSLAVGVFIGSLLTALSFWMAGRERKERFKLDIEREKALNAQLKLKDDRISSLHKEIERLMKDGKLKKR